MIDYFSLGHPLVALRSHYALKARRQMIQVFLATFNPSPDTKVLDLGITPDESLPESNLFEQLYPYRNNLTAASIEDASAIEKKYPGITFKKIKKGLLPFENAEFDIVFCSAVLEHVGNRDDQRQFIAETLRVGKHFFITTPNRYFPMEFHTLLPLLHWLPQTMHQAILRKLNKNFWAKTENLNLLSPMELYLLFPESASISLKLIRIFGWPSNILAYDSV